MKIINMRMIKQSITAVTGLVVWVAFVIATPSLAAAAAAVCTPAVSVDNWSMNTAPIRRAAVQAADNTANNTITMQNTTFLSLSGKKVEFITVAKE